MVWSIGELEKLRKVQAQTSSTSGYGGESVPSSCATVASSRRVRVPLLNGCFWQHRARCGGGDGGEGLSGADASSSSFTSTSSSPPPLGVEDLTKMLVGLAEIGRWGQVGPRSPEWETLGARRVSRSLLSPPGEGKLGDMNVHETADATLAYALLDMYLSRRFPGQRLDKSWKAVDDARDDATMARVQRALADRLQASVGRLHHSPSRVANAAWSLQQLVGSGRASIVEGGDVVVVDDDDGEGGKGDLRELFSALEYTLPKMTRDEGATRQCYPSPSSWNSTRTRSIWRRRFRRISFVSWGSRWRAL